MDFCANDMATKRAAHTQYTECMFVWVRGPMYESARMAMNMAGANNQHDSLNLLARGILHKINKPLAIETNRLSTHLFLFIIQLYNLEIIGKRIGYIF